jgi:hypothetical protein
MEHLLSSLAFAICFQRRCISRTNNTRSVHSLCRLVTRLAREPPPIFETVLDSIGPTIMVEVSTQEACYSSAAGLGLQVKSDGYYKKEGPRLVIGDRIA